MENNEKKPENDTPATEPIMAYAVEPIQELTELTEGLTDKEAGDELLGIKKPKSEIKDLAEKERSELIKINIPVNIIADPEAFISVLGEATSDSKGWTPQAILELAVNRASEAENLEAFFEKMGLDLNSLGKLAIQIKTKIPSSKNMTPKQQKMAIAAVTTGAHTLPLYNSGFYCSMRTITLYELDEVFRKVDIDSDMVGNIVGEYKHSILGFQFLQAIIEITHSLVNHSTLENWEDPKVFYAALDFDDIPAIIHYLTLTSFKFETVAHMVCKNTHNYSETIDLRDIIHTYELTEEARDHMLEMGSVTLEAAMKYRHTLRKGNCDVPHITTQGAKVTFRLKSPSVSHWLKVQQILVNKMIDRFGAPPSRRSKEFIAFTISTFNRNFLPWIDSIEVDHGEHGKFELTSYSAIVDMLDSISKEYSWEETLDKIVVAIYKFNNVAVLYSPGNCTVCNEPPEKKYVAWDPSQVFMVTTYQILSMFKMLED